MAKIKGVWIFNPNIVGTHNTSTTFEEAVMFISNGGVYGGMEFGYSKLTYAGIFNTQVQAYSYGWTDENFRIVDFGNEELFVSDQFYAMFTANASQAGGETDPPEEDDELLQIWKSTLRGIANAVRSKTGKTARMLVSEIEGEIKSITGGGSVEEYDGTVVIE